MRRLLSLGLLLGMAVPAFGGDTTPGTCLGGFGCDNQCPLAQQANAWRATGQEALAVRSRLATEHAVVVVRNLSKI